MGRLRTQTWKFRLTVKRVHANEAKTHFYFTRRGNSFRIRGERGLSEADIPRVLQLCLQMVSDEPARIQSAGKRKMQTTTVQNGSLALKERRFDGMTLRHFKDTMRTLQWSPRPPFRPTWFQSHHNRRVLSPGVKGTVCSAQMAPSRNETR